MNREKYEPIELEIIEFETEDVLTASSDPHEYETPITGQGNL